MGIGFAINGVDLADTYVSTDSFVGNSLWAWGDNANGQLGFGDIVHRSSPVQVGALNTWVEYSVSRYHTAAVANNGTLWTWGSNISGQLGAGNRTSYKTPIQIGTLTDWKQVTTYPSGYTTAIKTDGTLWAWGDNSYGQLGLGDTVHRSSPVQVGALNTWASLSVDSGWMTQGDLTYAIKTDGTLWVWGRSGTLYYEAALTGNKSSPVQVGTSTNWKIISASSTARAAIKTDGTLWTWGDNTYGQQGWGNTTSWDKPIQVGTQTNWKSVSTNGLLTFAIKTDGTLWAWGANGAGQLGLGDTVHRSSPVQVGAYNNWKQVSAHLTGAVAIKTDGTLWAWGDNSYGNLGTGNRTHRSSPVQVGTLTNWKKVCAGSPNIGGSSILASQTIF